MRRYILYDLLAAIVAGLCLCGLFTACGEDRGGDLPDDDPNSCLVTITLRASLPIRPPQTKAGEAISWENDDEYERDITDWLVVAYDESGVLAGYTSSEGTYNKNDDNSRTSVDMRLPVGTYRFYAFANLASLEGGEALLEQIKNTNSNPGDLGLSEEALIRAVNILASGNSIDGRNGTLGGKFGGTDTEGTGNRLRIPMSSYAQEHTLAPAPAPNTFKIPLIRMIGKIRVEITNNLSQAITVNRLDIMNLRKGSLPIWLLPWGDNKYLETAGNAGAESLAPDLPTGKEVASEHLFNEEIILAAATDAEKTVPAKNSNGTDNVKTYTRYIPEGNAGASEILLGVDIQGRPRTEHTTSFGSCAERPADYPGLDNQHRDKIGSSRATPPHRGLPDRLGVWSEGWRAGIGPHNAYPASRRRLVDPLWNRSNRRSSFGHRFHHQGVPNRRGWRYCDREI